MLSVSSSCLLNLYNLSTSLRRRADSRASSRTLSERWLAISEVHRNAIRATQFCGSAMVRVPTGGRKKKLKHKVDRIDIGIAYLNPHAAETTKIATNKLRATVVGLTCTYLK